MKKTGQFSLFALALSVFGIHAAKAETKLVFGFQLSAEQTTGKYMVLPWLETIKERTGGELTYDFIPGGAIVTMTSALEQFRAGGVDMSMVSPAYYRKELPANNLLVDIATTFSNRWAAYMAVGEMSWKHCPECVAELAANNVVALSHQVSEPYNLLCRIPVATADDLGGRGLGAVRRGAGGDAGEPALSRGL